MPIESFTTPAGRPARLVIRPETNDHNTAYSCLNENEYEMPPLQGVAWDIGAYIGAVTIGVALDNPGLRVIAVEPVPDNVRAISENLRLNGVENRVTLIAGAVGRGDVTVRYGYTGAEIATHHAWVGNMSILDRNAATQTATYRGLSIRELIYQYGIPSVVKIDTEGAEWTFLDDDDNCNLPLIVGEWHPGYGTQDDFRDLLPFHAITFTGPEAGPGGFRAVLL